MIRKLWVWLMVLMMALGGVCSSNHDAHASPGDYAGCVCQPAGGIAGDDARFFRGERGNCARL